MKIFPRLMLALALLAGFLVPMAANAQSAEAATYVQNVRYLANKYGCGPVNIVIYAWNGHQGAAAPWENKMYIKPGLSYYRLKYVVAHECAHFKQYRIGGSTLAGWYSQMNRMNAIYGGSNYSGLEQNADCVTRVLGLTGQHYTTSCSGYRRTAAWNTWYGRAS
jgi:hypothetical protein